MYSNLDDVYVHKGEKLSAKQEIGSVGINRITGEAEVELEIWKACASESSREEKSKTGTPSRRGRTGGRSL